MAKFSSLEMASALTAHQHIQIKNTLFGLSQKAINTPTGSPLRIVKRDYMPEAASKLERLLDTPDAKLAEVAASLHLTPTPVGNVRIEACLSRNGEFAPCNCCVSPTTFIAPLPSHGFARGRRHTL
ncbi:MAG: hypothetical protein J6I72_05525 [Muribaculaceae bacterium]|nr:hypothetical protein [Muribaculaceae bacterium]